MRDRGGSTPDASHSIANLQSGEEEPTPLVAVREIAEEERAEDGAGQLVVAAPVTWVSERCNPASLCRIPDSEPTSVTSGPSSSHEVPSEAIIRTTVLML